MKKNILIVMSCFILNSLDAQNNSSGYVPECPPGTEPAFVISCDGFNFHRPSKNCVSGFWFCFNVCTAWLVDCSGNVVSSFATSKNNTVTVFGKIIKNQIELHFPIALAAAKGYTTDDLKVFSVDEDDPFYKGSNVSYTMLKGQYPVRKSETELIVLVNFKQKHNI